MHWIKYSGNRENFLKPHSTHGMQYSDALNSSQPAYLRSFLSYYTLYVLYAPLTPICCRFLGSARPLPPRLPWFQHRCPLSIENTAFWYSRLFVITIHSVDFLKPSMPSAPILVVHTSVSDAASGLIYLFYYLLTYLLRGAEMRPTR